MLKRIYKLLKIIYYLYRALIRIPVNYFRKTRMHYSTKTGVGVRCDRSTIGSYNYIGKHSSLNSVILGNYCSIASNVHIGGMDHNYSWFSTSGLLNDQCVYDKITVIGNDVWIGTGCIIKQGVKIGDASVIGAGSFVNKDIPENTIAFGLPVKVYKPRFESHTFNLIKLSEYWNYPPKIARKILAEIKINEFK